MAWVVHLLLLQMILLRFIGILAVQLIFNQTKLYFNHTNLYLDISNDFAAIATNVSGFGTIGAFVSVLSVDEMIVRTIEKPEGTGEYFDYGSIVVGSKLFKISY